MVLAVEILDTSFLVSLYLRADSNHKRAISILKGLNGDMALPITILHETLTVLNYKSGIKKCRLAHTHLHSNKRITIYHFDKEDSDAIEAEFFSAQNLSMADCSVLYLAKKSGSKILSFDKKLLSKLK